MYNLILNVWHFSSNCQILIP
uniref:Uncharacterized protein n=1 Tax=Rhizophora mucronata TaxID=61149 RepID=A0A2P2NBS3_RHIMU